MQTEHFLELGNHLQLHRLRIILALHVVLHGPPVDNVKLGPIPVSILHALVLLDANVSTLLQHPRYPVFQLLTRIVRSLRWLLLLHVLCGSSHPPSSQGRITGH